MHGDQQSNLISLRQCICFKPIRKLKNELVGRYHMYKKITAVNQLNTDDLVIPLQNTQDDQCTAARDLREIITLNNQQIYDLQEQCVLPLVTKCVHFYGSNVIVRQLKRWYRKNRIIQNFRGWTDCAAYVYQNNAGRWLQAVINRIIDRDPHMNRTIWNALRFICQRRNIAVHGPITQADIRLLNDSVQYVRTYQTQNTPDYVEAVETLATALQTVSPDFFAPLDKDLAIAIFIMSRERYGKRSSQFNLPPAKHSRVSKQYVRPYIQTTSHDKDPYATANLAETLEELRDEAVARQKRREQADCVRRVSILFDVFGYVVVLPRLQTEYKGPLTINDWHDDVRTLLERSFEQRQLNKEQEELVQTVERVVTSRDLLTYEQWRCLLCLNLMAGSSGNGDNMKIIYREELEKVKKLATCVLDGAKQLTVLRLVSILESIPENTK